MLLLFQVCFFTGIALTLLSLVLGNVFEAFGIDGLDFDMEILGNSIFLPISPILFILFATVFGGVGWIVMDYHPGLATFLMVIIPILAGMVVSYLVHHFVIHPLKKAQNTSAPNAEDLVGISAKVTETIFSGGFGEIRYVINGNSYASPAKATNGGEIKSGKDVAICWIEEHVFYVSSLDDI